MISIIQITENFIMYYEVRNNLFYKLLIKNIHKILSRYNNLIKFFYCIYFIIPFCRKDSKKK